jgi:voltage-gated potassium channel Kch
MYYSFVTFTTLGLGDVYPATQTAARLVIFEVVVGYIMLGGLISIFATKLARRS